VTSYNSASTVLILHASGANRDGEAARAIALAGGKTEVVHINQLRSGDKRLADYGGLLLPGGFSYGDALGAGARLALDMQVYLHDQLHAFVAAGRPVLGICNGFQTLVKAGLLPGPAQATRGGIEEMARRRVTLTENAQGGFECRWVYLARATNATSPLLAGVDQLIFCPVAHGEGNFQAQDQAALDELAAAGLVALRYVDASGQPAQGEYPCNPNGSAGDIAGICNHVGNVLGLMPHPEDHVTPIQSPLRTPGGLGLPLFSAFVRCVG
jgi:phosphoribosylformylglycinamidine synthase